MIPVHSHRLLSRFIGILCYSQASSLLIRTLFSLIELFLWSYNFLGGIFYLYDGKMASLMTSLNSRLEKQQSRICIGETSAILYFAEWNKQKLCRGGSRIFSKRGLWVWEFKANIPGSKERGRGELEGNVWIRRFSTFWFQRYKFVKFETLLLRTKSTVQQPSGAPNDNFRKYICSEDDLRSRIFGTFVACLLLLGFSNI